MNPSLTPETDAEEFPVMTWPTLDNPLVVRANFARTLERQRDDALRQRDEWFKALYELKENLAIIIPALEIASGLKADDLRDTCPNNGLSSNEWVALWMARSIQEGAQNREA